MAQHHGRETVTWPQQGGILAMAGAGAKVRFATGVFEDLTHLNTAADALIALGLDPSDLCFVARQVTAPAKDAESWVLAERTLSLAWYQYGDPAPIAPGGWFANRAAALIAEALDTAVPARPSYRPASDVWHTINTHLAKGAFLLVARLPSALLQDQAVRTLLRHSRQPVHAEEFFLPAELGPSPSCGV